MENSKHVSVGTEAGDAAVFWVVLLHTCENISEVLPPFLQWWSADPSHQREYLAFQRIWRDLSDLKDHGALDCTPARAEFEPARPKLVDLGNVYEATQSGTVETDIAPPPSYDKSLRPARDTRWWTTLLLVAACLLIVIGVAIKGYRMTHPVDFAPCETCGLATGQQASGYGQTRSLSLVDGSEITLDANSQVTLDMAEDHRKVHLDRGEALFRVAKGHPVPFEVQVGTATLRAVGTVFSVEKTAPDWAETVVEEGEIRVFTSARTSYQLKARQAAEVRDGEFHLRSTSPSKVDARLAWTSGLLSLDGESLNDAAQRLNRYNRQKIEVDPALANRPVWGLFPAHSPAAFADALDQMLDIRHTVTKDAVSGVETIHLTTKKH